MCRRCNSLKSFCRIFLSNNMNSPSTALERVDLLRSIRIPHHGEQILHRSEWNPHQSERIPHRSDKIPHQNGGFRTAIYRFHIKGHRIPHQFTTVNAPIQTFETQPLRNWQVRNGPCSPCGNCKMKKWRRFVNTIAPWPFRQDSAFNKSYGCHPGEIHG